MLLMLPNHWSPLISATFGFPRGSFVLWLRKLSFTPSLWRRRGHWVFLCVYKNWEHWGAMAGESLGWGEHTTLWHMSDTRQAEAFVLKAGTCFLHVRQHKTPTERDVNGGRCSCIMCVKNRSSSSQRGVLLVSSHSCVSRVVRSICMTHNDVIASKVRHAAALSTEEEEAYSKVICITAHSCYDAGAIECAQRPKWMKTRHRRRTRAGAANDDHTASTVRTHTTSSHQTSRHSPESLFNSQINAAALSFTTRKSHSFNVWYNLFVQLNIRFNSLQLKERWWQLWENKKYSDFWDVRTLRDYKKKWF